MNTCASHRSFIIGRHNNSQRMNRSTMSILSIYFLFMLIFVSADTTMECGALETNTETDDEAETIVDSSTISSSSTTSADNNTQPKASSTTPTPTAILETEARTARELSIAVHNLHKDLKSCKTRINSINSGFQNLYSMHLAQIDGLRKCKEGMITSSDLQKIFDRNDNLSKIDTTKALMKEAESALDGQKRTPQQNEEITSKHNKHIRSLEDQIQQLRLREEAWERTISELVSQNDMLERRETAWKTTIADLMADIEIRDKREWWWEQMSSEMEGRIAGLSYHAILDRYGPGPHRISMVIEYDGNEHEIIIELAPIDLMPHSIHIFLSQISLGYWTRGNPAIVLNPGHVLQACPHPCLESKAMGGSYTGDPYEEMRQEGLDSVSFQEYHPDYPHEKYTIGFAGRPLGGPEFYINIMDNTLDHGPKNPMEGEGVEDEVDEAAMDPDPCFGRIVSGFEVVDKIAKESETRADLPDDAKEDADVDDNIELSESLLMQPIRIVAMNILEVDDSSSTNDSRDEL